MAKNKIERSVQEIAKTREKIAEQQEKLKALEAQKTEAENLEIVQMVRAVRMTPAQLNALLSGGMVPGRRAVSSAGDKVDTPTNGSISTLSALVFCACRALTAIWSSAILPGIWAICWACLLDTSPSPRNTFAFCIPASGC